MLKKGVEMKSGILGYFKDRRNYLVAIAGVLILSACSYQPISHYAREVLPEPVYVDVVLSRKEPQAGVYLKDELIKLLRTHFQEKVVLNRQEARTKIIVPKYSVTYSPITYDSEGYVTRYSASVNILIVINGPKEQSSKEISASEETNIEPGSLVSTKAREEAIRTSIHKAMDKFVAYLAKKGYRK